MMDKVEIAQSALQQMLHAGFHQAQVVVNVSEKTELNIAHDDASLLRSTEDHSLSLTGILGGRKAGVTMTDLSEQALLSGVQDLLEKAAMAPVDEANAVSVNEEGEFIQGPQEADLELLVAKAEELLSFRAKETPLMSIEEGVASHEITRSLLLTSRGSTLSSSTGSYSLSALGSAREGDKNSAMNYSGGTANDLSIAHAAEFFYLGEMFRDTEKQIHTCQFEDKFQGDVILAPEAVADLVSWLMRQLSDMALIGKNSLYLDSVGKMIASPLLTLNSRFNGPGCDPVTADGFAAPDFSLVDKGELKSLLASHYGSKKTGIPHRPCA
ncbi:MAG: metallopeptidase TldD-related protein, partial [Gammaproteobacteria bacterium]|nr:metallopeptidase TldD-related protein [Gammaproteobacteria bacterium]